MVFKRKNKPPRPVVNKEETWIKHYWRPAIAWQYFAVCIFDFILAPLLHAYFFYKTGSTYVQWEPITLQASGFYHLSMGAIIGVAAWTRGQEKISRVFDNYGYSEYSRESEYAQQSPVEYDTNRGL